MSRGRFWSTTSAAWVEDLENVRFIQTQVADLVLQGDRVTGVVTAAPESGGGEGETLAAEFVVDAMGRNSPVEGWLARHGWESAPVDSMRIDLGYATAAFHRGDELGSTVIAHSSPGPASGYQPTLTEPGALAAVEGERWSVVLAWPRRPPPRSRPCGVPPADAPLRRPHPDGGGHLRDDRRRQDVPLRREPTPRALPPQPVPRRPRRRGRRSGQCQPGLRPGPDAVGVGGQRPRLLPPLHPYPQAPAWDYFRLAEAVVDAAWQLSTAADLAQPHVTGPYPRGYRVQKWVADKLTEASVVDSAVNAQYMGVVNMELPPKALTDPRFLARAARVLLSS